VFLTGDTVTYGQVADKLETGLGRPFKCSVSSVPFLKRELAKGPDNMMRKCRAAFAMGRCYSWDKAGTFNARHAIPVTDLDAWIDANLLVRQNAG
tara:strand:- start:400 stop:684 length:285 start_codon:yes stop_codon:yes gene_type:complete